ncbi:hypothetical protein F4776DRAFT_676583 [Hypoxylon sp. NC0597]|nr:hypothetical protein F4776DRAFT_676583 [Hypoxylon sp. NC0597]
MDQVFELMAPRDRRALHMGTKFETLLFYTWPSEVVKLFVVPVLPKYPSSTSNATSSTLAQSRRDVKTFQTVTGRLPQQTSARGSEKRKTSDETALHFTRHQKRARVIDRKSNDKSGANDPITIFSLPPELHHLIFSHTENIDDVVCLAVTNRHFWEVGREHIDKYFASFFGQWAGKNIVCAGKNVQPGDYPPELFSAQEIAHLGRKKFNVPVAKVPITDNFFDITEGEDNSSDETPDLPFPFTLHHFGLRSVSKWQPIWMDIERNARDIYRRCQHRNAIYCLKKDQGLLLKRSAIEVKESSYFPENERWILRNLTTKEFVRSESIALNPEFIHGPRISVRGFGEVVMSRIFWTTSPTVKVGEAENIFRGVWAGHRFDITTASRHEEQTKRETWSDVGVEVAKEIESIWAWKFGPGWSEMRSAFLMRTHGE